jgi:hypothetical protein
MTSGPYSLFEVMDENKVLPTLVADAERVQNCHAVAWQSPMLPFLSCYSTGSSVIPKPLRLFSIDKAGQDVSNRAIGTAYPSLEL